MSMCLEIDDEKNPYNDLVEETFEPDDLVVQFTSLYLTFDKSLDIPLKLQDRNEYQLKVRDFVKRNLGKDIKLVSVGRADSVEIAREHELRSSLWRR